MSARSYVQLSRSPILKGSHLSNLDDKDLGFWVRLLALANGWYMPGYIVDESTFAPLSQNRLLRELKKERKPLQRGLARLESAGVLAHRDIAGLRFYGIPEFDKHQRQARRCQIGSDAMDRLFRQIEEHLAGAGAGVARPGAEQAPRLAEIDLQPIVKAWFAAEGFEGNRGERRKSRASSRLRAGHAAGPVLVGGRLFRKIAAG